MTENKFTNKEIVAMKKIVQLLRKSEHYEIFVIVLLAIGLSGLALSSVYYFVLKNASLDIMIFPTLFILGSFWLFKKVRVMRNKAQTLTKEIHESFESHA